MNVLVARARVALLACAVLAVFVVFAAACGPPQQLGAQPSWRRGAAGGSAPPATSIAPVTFAPSAASARAYNEPLQPPPRTPLGDAVTAAVDDAAAAAHIPPPVADDRLARACDELAQIVPEQGIIGYSFVEFALQHNGIIEPSPHVLVVWARGDALPEIVEQLESRLAEVYADGATARFGVGYAQRRPDGVGAIVFALQGSGVATQPIPRALPAGGQAPIEATLAPRYKDPEVFVTHDDGQTEKLPVAARGTSFKAQLACGGHAGRQQVEINAESSAGATVLANFPVWCGAAPPETLTVAPTADDIAVTSPADAEQRLFALANQARTDAHLPPLAWDDRVAAVARGYADEMARTKLVAHVSPTSGSAADRVHAADIHTGVVLENVARAYGVGEAHTGLMNSPGHRANLMSTSATHVGIGVALGDEVGGRRELFVAQVFIRIPPTADPVAVAELVRARIGAVHTVAADAQLAASAQRMAIGLATGKSRDAVWKAAGNELESLNGRYGRIGSVISAVAETDAIDGKELLGEYKPIAIGVGIAQGPHPELGPGAIWVVVLMGEP